MSKRLSGLAKQAAQPALGLSLLLTMHGNPAIAAISRSTAEPTTSPANTSIAQVTSEPTSTSQPGLSRGEDAYRLGAGDRVRIDIFQVPQYSGENEVQVDGTFNLPLVGTIPVDGMTIEEASALLSAEYADFFRRPVVTITLLARRPLQIAVSGEVTQPGSYSVNQEGSLPTLTQLLETAGGITRSADYRQIQVRRPLASGGEEVITVNLWDLLQSGDLSYDITLRDGDTIYIPATDVNLAEAPIIAASTFAANPEQPINVAVVGEVFQPGSYTVTGGTGRIADAGEGGGVDQANTLPTVTRAIQLAGGIKPLADIREVEIRRLIRTGEEQTFKVDLWALLQGDFRQDAILQEGDTIIIPVADALTPEEAAELRTSNLSPGSIRVNVVGEVEAPGAFSLASDTTLNQAILAAGGFNTRARRGSVDLIRLNPDGTVTRQKVEIDLDNGIDEANNPLLQDNDVVIIGRSDLASISDTVGTVLSPLGGIFSLFEFPFRFLRLFD
ncbi:MAG: sugar ABC transporter substrate-binding protein [Cyanobacteria bacterium CRU_2_1]|nr:sugar ABC transporter substrate-binding protein [Cyanobacteria bacterium RU_5_0]NJR63221.1 sugar ABC transporter substrate-binding protein [Cyanobacteria bacterium CRU_2_1]